MSLDAKLRDLEARAALVTATDPGAMEWDLSQLSTDELDVLRGLAAKAARPKGAALWHEFFDHARFAAMFTEGREPKPCPHCGKRPK